MKRTPRLLSTLFASVLTLSSANAVSVVTDPVGFVNVDISASSDGVSSAITPFSITLLNNPSITGLVASALTGVGSNTLSNSSAGWVASQLASPGSPYYLLVKSGNAKGRLFLITANTTTQLTLDTQGVDLTTLQFTTTGNTPDTYEILGGQTLSNLFGAGTANIASNGVVGGTLSQFSSAQTDKVVINDGSGVLRTYFYNTDLSQWRRTGNSADQGSLPISPNAGLWYYRVGTTPLAYTFAGKVPTTNYVRLVPNSGTAIMAAYFPINSTLGALNLNQLTNWRKYDNNSVDITTADKVIVRDASGIIRSYYYDSLVGFWKRNGNSGSQNAVPIPTGSSIYCTRFGTSGGSDLWSYTIPYTL